MQIFIPNIEDEDTLNKHIIEEIASINLKTFLEKEQKSFPSLYTKDTSRLGYLLPT